MTGHLEYRFEELPLIEELGFSGALVSGSADIRFYDEGEWGIGAIYLDGSRYKNPGWEERKIEIDRNCDMYLTIWGVLTRDGKWSDAISVKVRERIEAAANDRADHDYKLAREMA